MIDRIVDGFCLGIGLIIAVLLPFALLAIIASCKTKKAEVHLWKRYQEKMLEAQNYEEANKVKVFIEGKGDEDKIPLPYGYQVKSKVKLIEKGESGMEMKTYRWIVKK